MTPARQLPPDFVAMLDRYPAFDGLAGALAATAPSVSVRLNRGKGAMPAPGLKPVPWCPDGFYLADRPQFTLDPAMHQGLYYVQDASSMVMQRVAAVLSAGKPLRWLDACAAPGGKTTAVLSALPADSVVVANEFDGRRARALVENLERWGDARFVATNADTARFAGLKGLFDVIAVDAPCSGEGMMRKEEVAVSQWSPALVQQCAALQREIVGNLWPALRPGGFLVYSTCTFNTAENEENIAFFAEKYGAVPVHIDIAVRGIAAQVCGTLPMMRFLPSRIDGEGLALAVLQKPDDGDTAVAKPAAVRDAKKKGGGDLAAVESWLEPGCILQKTEGGVVCAMPPQVAAVLPALTRAVTPRGIIAASTAVAVQKGRDWLPLQALATSRLLRPEAFATAGAGYGAALDFLRGQALCLDRGVPHGIVLLQYGGHPLGFVKNLGNRANNLLPASRRIHMPGTPGAAPPVVCAR